MEQNAEQCPSPLNFSGKFLPGFAEIDHICIGLTQHQNCIRVLYI